MLTSLTAPVVSRPMNPPRFGLGRKKDFWQRAEQNGWQKPPLYKRAWEHRYRVAMLPLLGLFIPGLGAGLSAAPAEVPKAPPASSSASESQSVGEWLKAAPLDKENYVVLFALLLALAAVGELPLAFRELKGDRSTPHSKDTAYHELGHLLTAIGIQYPAPVQSVEVKGSSGGVTRFDIDVKDKTPEELYRFCRQAHLASNGGFAMDRLRTGSEGLYGKIPMGDNLAKTAMALGLTITGFKSNKRDTIKFLLTSQQQAMEVLIRFDKKTVDALAERLANEGHWDAAKIQEMIQEYGLDKVK